MLRWETATQYWDPMLPRRRNVINELSKRRRLHTPGTRPRAEEEERLPTKRHGQIKTEGGRPRGGLPRQLALGGGGCKPPEFARLWGS